MKLKRKLYTSVRYTKKALDTLQILDMVGKRVPSVIGF